MDQASPQQIEPVPQATSEFPKQEAQPQSQTQSQQPATQESMSKKPELQRQPKDDKTIYNASVSQILWRNFLAGMARGLGSLIMQLVGYALLVGLFLTFVWPIIEPMVGSMSGLVDTLKNSTGQFKEIQENINLDFK